MLIPDCQCINEKLWHTGSTRNSWNEQTCMASPLSLTSFKPSSKLHQAQLSYFSWGVQAATSRVWRVLRALWMEELLNIYLHKILRKHVSPIRCKYIWLKPHLWVCQNSTHYCSTPINYYCCIWKQYSGYCKFTIAWSQTWTLQQKPTLYTPQDSDHRWHPQNQW